MQALEKLVHLTQAAAGRLTVRSALNPFLWLCAIVSPACFLFACLFRADHGLASLLIIAGVFPVVFTCLVGGLFAVFKPDRLQSEHYQLRRGSLPPDDRIVLRQQATEGDVTPGRLVPRNHSPVE